MGHSKIDGVPSAVFVGFPGHGIRFQHRFQQSSPQKIGVTFGKFWLIGSPKTSVSASTNPRRSTA